MHLVDEDHVAALRLGDLFQDGLHPLLELAAVLGPGQHGRDIQLEQLLVRERSGDVPRDHALGQTLHDRRLPDARLADEHRVVLGAAGEDLDHAPDLLVAADDGVEFATPSLLRQIPGVAGERLELVLGILVQDAVRSANRFHRGTHLGERRSSIPEDAPRIVLLTREAEQKMLGRDVLVPELAGDLLGRVERLAEVAGEMWVRSSLHAGHAIECLDGAVPDPRHGDLQLLEDRHHDAFLLPQQGMQQMHPVHLGVSPAAGFLRGRLEGLGGLHGQSVGTQHRSVPWPRVYDDGLAAISAASPHSTLHNTQVPGHFSGATRRAPSCGVRATAAPPPT